MTGRSSRSAIFRPQRLKSYTAWGDGAKRMTHPALRAYIRSLWSPLMDSGPDTVRQATLSTMGIRVPDWTGSCSRA